MTITNVPFKLHITRSLGSQKFSINHSPSTENSPRERFETVVDLHRLPRSFRMQRTQGNAYPCNHRLSRDFTTRRDPLEILHDDDSMI